ncbi:MAG: hypothetical protein HW388_925 [Dehalococcoidia bacterium]|nr:hypothetical protein [Dehalococcoidia bacterium]
MKRNRDRVLLALVVAGLIALATGCSSGSPATPTIASTHGAPSLAMDTLQVNLGTVARSQEGMATFLVINQGGMPLQVEGVSIQVEQGCDIAETIEEGYEIQPGEIALLPVTLGKHRELGPHRLLVNVTSNDPLRRVTTASLRFVVVEDEASSGTGPRLRVDKEMIDIGTVPNDWPMYERFTLRNDGDAPLVLEGDLMVRVEEGC